MKVDKPASVSVFLWFKLATDIQATSMHINKPTPPTLGTTNQSGQCHPGGATALVKDGETPSVEWQAGRGGELNIRALCRRRAWPGSFQDDLCCQKGSRVHPGLHHATSPKAVTLGLRFLPNPVSPVLII